MQVQTLQYEGRAWSDGPCGLHNQAMTLTMIAELS